MQKITSKENEFIKHIKKLKDKKYRDQSNEYIIEGIKLIQEAIQERKKNEKLYQKLGTIGGLAIVIILF